MSKIFQACSPREGYFFMRVVLVSTVPLLNCLICWVSGDGFYQRKCCIVYSHGRCAVSVGAGEFVHFSQVSRICLPLQLISQHACVRFCQCVVFSCTLWAENAIFLPKEEE